MILRVTYPELSAAEGFDAYDDIEADEIGTNVAELRRCAVKMPLAPGDVVSHNADGLITGVVQWAEVWLVEVEFKLPINLAFMKAPPPNDPSNIKIDATIEAWQRDAYVTEIAGYSYVVAAPDRDWIKDKVQGCPYVDYMELIRYPDMALDFDVARAHAAIGTLTDGPWA